MKKSSHGKHPLKKHTVLQHHKRLISPMILVLAIAFLAGAVAAAYLITDAGQRGLRSNAPPKAQGPGSSNIRYPVALFDDGQARHFEYAVNGLTIRYFVLKSADGVIGPII
jgi:hypothetical protein